MDKKIFVPRTLLLLTSFIANIRLGDVIFISAYLYMVRLLDALLGEKTTLGETLIALSLLGIFLLFVKIKIAGYHGAEHMVIEAYQRSQAFDIPSVRKESPISPRCGGRFLLPLVALIVESIYFNLHWSIMLVGFEAIFLIDKKIGFANIPIFSEASILLQRYITTREPSENEIKTAHTAMAGLVREHKKVTVPQH